RDLTPEERQRTDRARGDRPSVRPDIRRGGDGDGACRQDRAVTRVGERRGETDRARRRRDGGRSPPGCVWNDHLDPIRARRRTGRGAMRSGPRGAGEHKDRRKRKKRRKPTLYEPLWPSPRTASASALVELPPGEREEPLSGGVVRSECGVFRDIVYDLFGHRPDLVDHAL